MTTQDDNTLPELATILAAGLLRLLERKSSQNLRGETESLLDCGRPFGGDVARNVEEINP
ncbi:hypothetical protein E4K64_33545 [Bradyrhizobium frederickii]|jgi:hypothetical protein|uniref:Uncharacterized protein n=1 Tax=Bradyrhizobium frederickii TaxID=2560054 RepID=A0A4Y9NN33_9BRAD|nr:hypothetical protein E4K64_33545 [Bradyrhizobium frederickii]